MKKSIQQKGMFILKVVFLFLLLVISKFSKEEKAAFDLEQQDKFTLSAQQQISPRILPTYPVLEFTARQ